MGNELSTSPAFNSNSNSNGKTNNNSNNDSAYYRRMERIDASFAKYIQQGVDYSIRIVVKGDIATGKTSLLTRLKGGEFSDTQKAHGAGPVETTMVSWRSKTDPKARIVLHIWEEITGKKNASSKTEYSNDKNTINTELKLEHNNGNMHGTNADNSDSSSVGLDLYRGTAGVIMLMHPGKRWTLEYIRRELPRVPKDMPVLLICNFMDLNEEERSQVDISELKSLAEECNNDNIDVDINEENNTSSRQVRVFVIEASLKMCYGLNRINTFLHVPYLKSKKQLLQSILQGTDTSIQQATDALNNDNANSDNDNVYETYEMFMDKIARMKQLQLQRQAQNQQSTKEIHSPSGVDIYTKERSDSYTLPLSSPTRYITQSKSSSSDTKDNHDERTTAGERRSEDPLREFYGDEKEASRPKMGITSKANSNTEIANKTFTTNHSMRRPVVKGDDDGYDD